MMGFNGDYVCATNDEVWLSRGLVPTILLLWWILLVLINVDVVVSSYAELGLGGRWPTV
jgi:hypothetical protein